jgi:hypothetical protein
MNMETAPAKARRSFEQAEHPEAENHHEQTGESGDSAAYRVGETESRAQGADDASDHGIGKDPPRIVEKARSELPELAARGIGHTSFFAGPNAL